MVDYLLVFIRGSGAVGTTFNLVDDLCGRGTAFMTRGQPKNARCDARFCRPADDCRHYWSLLAPALEMAEGGRLPAVVPRRRVLWAVALRLMIVLPHLHPGWTRIRRRHPSHSDKPLCCAGHTLHNIPEGLAVGVAFGAAAAGLPEATLAGALSLAIGIGIQNFPEGLAVAAPLRRAGYSRSKSFWVGQASGLVEPAAGVLGAFAVLSSQSILPYALAFAAGAMIFVVVEELIPESQQEGNGDLATMGVMVGFTVMMILDVALG
jgi:ZIP family zinc transporter